MKFYDESFTQPSCLNLVIFPPDELIESTMVKLYKFDKECEYKLVVSQKAGITCNSPHNADKKTSGNFPSSYIQFNVNKGTKTLFTYYKDLKNKPTQDDISDSFYKVKESLKLP